jgi:hypothetical protein
MGKKQFNFLPRGWIKTALLSCGVGAVSERRDEREYGKRNSGCRISYWRLFVWNQGKLQTVGDWTIRQIAEFQDSQLILDKYVFGNNL